MRRSGNRSSGSTGAMVVATVALLLALGGAAYAGTRIGPGGLRNNAVTTEKIRNKAVTTSKLAVAERSQGFVTNESTRTILPAGTSTTVATLDLPKGRYVVNSSTIVINGVATANAVNCSLNDDGNVISRGNASLAAQSGDSQTESLTGTADGGRITLSCGAPSQAEATSRVITAVRVGSLKSQ